MHNLIRYLSYCICTGVVVTMTSFRTLAQEDSGELARLKSLSIEELLNLEVTTVARGPQRLSEAASAVQVITREDILRSGATNIPEALRLSSNLQVAQLNSHAWIISARGFNTVFANKLLVLIDGRSVYTPLFGGVLWDMQHVLLEDVEQIEIISGPGGTMWGANAVNGVINIITRSSSKSKGLFFSAASGPGFASEEINEERKPFGTADFLKHSFAARWGGRINERLDGRVYAQHTARNATFVNDTQRNIDDWLATQAGFRFDFNPNTADLLTIQGDVYSGTKNAKGIDAGFDGQNILTRWTRKINDQSEFTLQLYYDRYFREDPNATTDEMQTYDIDFQHRFSLGESNSLLWGLGYRHVEDHLINNINIGLLPPYRTMPLYTAFIQNTANITDYLTLTIGSKFQHNVFTGMEFQPGVKLAATINPRATVWAGISEAVRTPSRMDVDYYLFLPPDPVIVSGDIKNFVSEKLKAFELGYRTQPFSSMSISVAGFYNEYRDVYSVEFQPDNTLKIMNGSEAETWGGELSGVLQASAGWRIRAGFTYIDNSLRPKPGRDHDPSYLTNDVKHQAMLHSMLTISKGFEFDLTARYLDYIPQSFATARVPEYFTFDVRLAYSYEAFQLSIVGQNLWSERHAEFGTAQIPRSVYAKIACRL